VGHLRGDAPFPAAAERALGDDKLRRNLLHATSTIRAKRSHTVAELDDWQQLRAAGAAIKDEVLAHLDDYLLQLEQQVIVHGGSVHWARDANEANRIVTGLVAATGTAEVIKVKSMVTQEIGLNEALAAAGVDAIETDLAELIVQLGRDWPSRILVPAIHRNRTEIRDIFLREIPGVDPALTDDPAALAETARRHLRHKFRTARVAISGANFAVAETGTLVVVESEGNGRMCLTLPPTLITVMGIEKVVPRWRDMEVFLQLLPRSSTAERMNSYTSTWTGSVDGQDFHLVLAELLAGRLADYGALVRRCAAADAPEAIAEALRELPRAASSCRTACPRSGSRHYRSRCPTTRGWTSPSCPRWRP
jgi:L-lactate dehydrogenase complex protein LldF